MLSRPRPRQGFTLVEVLVVIGIIALLVGILMPALTKARAAANTTKCLANIRNMEVAHTMYVGAYRGAMIRAGLAHSGWSGAGHDPRVSWLVTLEEFFKAPLLHRCPSDMSPAWDEPYPGSSPPLYRVTSFGINNYVDPSHAPPGVGPYVKITQVRSPSTTVHFIEVAEVGNYASSDHVHVEMWYSPVDPDLVAELAGNQMALARHGGKQRHASGLANYGFLDGHAETLRFAQVYKDRQHNRFDPGAVPN